MFNLSATLNVGKLVYNPSLCLPHTVVQRFDQLHIPLQAPDSSVVIKGVVLDKDNCFAKDKDDKVWHEYQETWDLLKQSYAPKQLLIVSNSAGTDDDVEHKEAQRVEQNTGVKVLRHSTKKPGCIEEIMSYFRDQGITDPKQIAVVGDRLFTDIVMANMMGSWGFWISDGVEKSPKIFPRIERQLYESLTGKSV
ncbi:Piso0_002322 [Millerozyma farinosa CBS 7064]|uniref:Piso0_002322 protein n=1 Tax=Pichia sorbitophila (strain ATCC MYA-4447 / BCRC 22081 / CBS 7064 / NBRC 10061 / NRRL Y-12695) TaxID=559304 RepID=G8YCA9_PICSO|nr:Piso0_002322 [Millerozyma farinosa CBS 7064]